VTLLDDVSIETMAVNTVLLNTAFLQATSIGESFYIISSVRKKVTGILSYFSRC
jgi:hypothetical protein